MQIPTSPVPAPTTAHDPSAGIRSKLAATDRDDSKLKDAFTQFVGETFFSQLIESARSGLGESGYFNGGQAEKVFTGQLDQVLAEQMTEATGDQIADPMYQLMMLPKSR